MRKSSERGSGRVQFLIVMTVIVATAYAGYLYVPVSFRAHAYKDLMQHYADVAATLGYEPSWAGEQLLKSTVVYDVPPDAIITRFTGDDRVEARVDYTRLIEDAGFHCTSQLEHTDQTAAFL